jgi:hypothetical protein
MCPVQRVTYVSGRSCHPLIFQSVDSVNMHLTHKCILPILLIAVTGLLLIVVYFGRTFTDSKGASRQKMSAVLAPVLNTKNIIVPNSPKNPQNPLVRHDFISTDLVEFSGDYKVCKDSISSGEHTSRPNVIFCKALTIWDLSINDKTVLRARPDAKRRGLTSVFEGNADNEKLVNVGDAPGAAWIRNNFNAVSYPSTLILTHLLFNRVDTFPRRFCLVLGHCDLRSRVSFGFDSSSYGRNTLIAQYSRLIAHNPELAVNKNARNSGGKDSPPSGAQYFSFKIIQIPLYRFYGLCLLVIGGVTSRLSAGLLLGYDRLWNWDFRRQGKLWSDSFRVSTSVFLMILTGVFFYQGLRAIRMID